MNHAIWWLFAIPTIAIIIIVLNQFWDEMFKKKFVIDRRNPSSRGSPADRRRSGKSDARNRRHNDPIDPSVQSAATPESSKDRAQPGLEPSGISN
jgi:FtsZ-interacting cell division protein ZipA